MFKYNFVIPQSASSYPRARISSFHDRYAVSTIILLPDAPRLQIIDYTSYLVRLSHCPGVTSHSTTRLLSTLPSVKEPDAAWPHPAFCFLLRFAGSRTFASTQRYHLSLATSFSSWVARALLASLFASLLHFLQLVLLFFVGCLMQKRGERFLNAVGYSPFNHKFSYSVYQLVKLESSGLRHKACAIWVFTWLLLVHTSA